MITQHLAALRCYMLVFARCRKNPQHCSAASSATPRASPTSLPSAACCKNPANQQRPPQLHLAAEVQKKLSEYITTFLRTWGGQGSRDLGKSCAWHVTWHNTSVPNTHDSFKYWPRYICFSNEFFVQSLFCSVVKMVGLLNVFHTLPFCFNLFERHLLNTTLNKERMCITVGSLS